MKSFAISILLVIACNVATVCAQTAPDAVVVSVKGKAFVKDGKDAEPKPLHKNDRLFSEQQVRCEKGCKELMISYCNVPLPIANGPDWTTIVSINCAAPEVPRGGGRKSAGTTIIFPREAETILPRTFALKLAPKQLPAKARLTLKVNLGEEIWSEIVNQSMLTSASVHLAQKMVDAQRAGNLRLILILDRDDGKGSETVTFKLISLTDQKNLDKKLEIFEGVPDVVLRYLGRGLTFCEYRVYDEGVVELEKAFKIVQSRGAGERTAAGLLRLLILINYQAYNDERVRQLCSSIKNYASLPLVCSQYSK